MSCYPDDFNASAYLAAYGPEPAPNPHDGGYCASELHRLVDVALVRSALERALHSPIGDPDHGRAARDLDKALGRHDTASLLDLMEAVALLIVHRDERVPADMERAFGASAGVDNFIAAMRCHPMVMP